jgi:hypothetical protein
MINQGQSPWFIFYLGGIINNGFHLGVEIELIMIYYYI